MLPIIILLFDITTEENESYTLQNYLWHISIIMQIYTLHRETICVNTGWNKYFLKNKEHEYTCETSIGYPAKPYLLAERSTGKRDPYKETIYKCIHFFYMDM